LGAFRSFVQAEKAAFLSHDFSSFRTSSYDSVAGLEENSDRKYSVYAAPGISPSLLSNRISFCLNLVGPSVTIDTACSSSLVALDVARRCQSDGLCSYALVGGVNLILNPSLTKLLCQAKMLSPDSRCKAFDSSADGYGRSEAVVALVLASRTQIEMNKMKVFCWIHGSAVNHGGKAANLVAPNMNQQYEVIKRALDDADLTPFDISFVEAHGTGTRLGDPIEVAALKNVFGDTQINKRKLPLFVGSLKSNYGHTEGAAGLAGFLKGMLCLLFKKVPPTIHLNKINPIIDTSNFNVVFPSDREVCLESGAVAISSFGFGGTNCSVIISLDDMRCSKNIDHTTLVSGSLSNSPKIIKLEQKSGIIETLKENNTSNLTNNSLIDTKSDLSMESIKGLYKLLKTSKKWDKIESYNLLNWDTRKHCSPLIGRVEFQYNNESQNNMKGNNPVSISMVTTLRRDMFHLLKDHIIQGVVVVPGATFVEYLAELGSVVSRYLQSSYSMPPDSNSTSCVLIQSFEIERPLFLPFDYAHVDSVNNRMKSRIQIESFLDIETGNVDVFAKHCLTALSIAEKLSSKCKIKNESSIKYVTANLKKEYVTNSVDGESQGKCTMDSFIVGSFKNVKEMLEKMRERPVDAFYYNASLIGLHLGSRFKTIQRIFQGKIEMEKTKHNDSKEQEVFSKHEAPVSETVPTAVIINELKLSDNVDSFESQFIVHPAILDGAIQSASCLIITSGAPRYTIYVPVFGRNIRLYPSKNRCHTYVCRCLLRKSNKRYGIVQIEIFNKESGELLAWFEELRLQSVNFSIPVNISKELLFKESFTPTNNKYTVCLQSNHKMILSDSQSLQMVPEESTTTNSDSNELDKESNISSEEGVASETNNTIDDVGTIRNVTNSDTIVKEKIFISEVDFSWNVVLVECGTINLKSALHVVKKSIQKSYNHKNSLEINVIETNMQNLGCVLQALKLEHIFLIFGGALYSSIPQVVTQTAANFVQIIHEKMEERVTLETTEKKPTGVCVTLTLLFLSFGAFSFQSTTTDNMKPSVANAALKGFVRTLRLEAENHSGTLFHKTAHYFQKISISLFDLDKLVSRETSAIHVANILCNMIYQWPMKTIESCELLLRDNTEWVPSLEVVNRSICGPMEPYLGDSKVIKTEDRVGLDHSQGADKETVSIRFRPQNLDDTAVESSELDLKVHLITSLLCVFEEYPKCMIKMELQSLYDEFEQQAGIV
jgi:3-oxoacyl-(acyl-carrier-protein) synthase